MPRTFTDYCVQLQITDSRLLVNDFCSLGDDGLVFPNPSFLNRAIALFAFLLAPEIFVTAAVIIFIGIKVLTYPTVADHLSARFFPYPADPFGTPPTFQISFDFKPDIVSDSNFNFLLSPDMCLPVSELRAISVP